MTAPASPDRSPGRERLQQGFLWFLAFSGCLAIVEPSPYDFVFLLLLPALPLFGPQLHRSGLVLIGFLLAFNLGGLASLAPFLDDKRSVTYVITTVYLSVTAVVLSMLLARRPVERLEALKQGYIWAACVASVAGALGYFDVAGLGDALTLYGRASGTFKDPNVLGVFVILPVVSLVLDLLLRRGSALRNGLLLAVILFGGVLLSFSRGAWMHTLASILLALVLTFCMTSSARVRLRIVVLCGFGAVVLVVGVMALLSVESISTMLADRASLSKDYDLGETGRFGNQLRSLRDLIELPNGYGPLRFRTHHPEDPHNVYVNAFASYGWLGGFGYLLLVLSTVYVGWRMVVVRSPVQAHAVAIWSVLFVQILQGFQIDTDHWRHWFFMLGLTWGLYAITRPARLRRPQAPPVGATATRQAA